MDNRHGEKGLSPELLDLIECLRVQAQFQGGHSSRDHELGATSISREVGALYERLRFAVDNKEEHFFRRHAIRRILRRASIFSSDAQKLLTILLSDLVRGGYLAEGAVGAEKHARALVPLQAFVTLHRALREQRDGRVYHANRKYLLDIIAGAVEEKLFPTEKEEFVVVMMARIVDKVLRGEQFEALPVEKRRMLVYVASWRSLFSGDASLLRYKLWLLEHAEWDMKTSEEMAVIARSFPQTMLRINGLIDHDLGRRLVPKLHNLTIAFLLLYDIVLQYGLGVEGVLADRALFESRIRESIQLRYRRDLARAHRRAIRAILYIFVTKSALAVLVESFYVLYLKHALDYIALSVNLVAHPTLLFVLTAGLARPSARNTERAVRLVDAIAFGGELEPIVIKPHGNGILTDLALALYITILSLSLYGIMDVLVLLGFHTVDIGLFIFFLLLVLYFGFRIRFGAYRMRFSGTKEGLLRAIMEILLLPLVSLGRWMTIKFERFNIAILLLDFLIEAPLRLVLRFLDSFTSLVERKREEIGIP